MKPPAKLWYAHNREWNGTCLGHVFRSRWSADAWCDKQPTPDTWDVDVYRLAPAKPKTRRKK